MKTLAQIRKLFISHMLRNMAIGISMLFMALFLGMLGYHFLEGQSWIDAFVNAAMILSGMGPVNPLKTQIGKIFAGSYALFSGLAFIILAGIVLAPVIHHILRKIHIENRKQD